MNKQAKRITICLIAVVVFIMTAISAIAAETPVVKIVSQDKVTGSIVVSITAEAGESIKLYKKTGENTTLVNTITCNGSAQEFMVTFNELDCNYKGDSSIFVETSDGVKSGYLSVKAHGPHRLGNWTTIKATGCTEDGVAGRKCTVCNEILEKKTMPATGHNWGEPTWTWAKDYSSCTAVITCKKNSEHTTIHTIKTITVSKTVNATCISAGSKTYTASFGANGKTYSTSKTVTIPKTAHTLTDWTISKAPTCTTAGTRVKRCTACRDIIISEPVQALGHNYTVTYKWSKDNTMCTATAVCSRDKTHVQTETVKGLDKIIKNASCIAAGKMTRTATFTNPLFKAQTKTASITGSHVDANKDDICDVCRMRLNVATTTKAETTTQSRNLFDKLFNKNETTSTTSSDENITTTEAPAEMVTSYKFDETTGQTITQPNQHNGNTNKLSPKLIIVLIIAVIVSLIGAVVCIITLLRKDKKDERKN